MIVAMYIRFEGIRAEYNRTVHVLVKKKENTYGSRCVLDAKRGWYKFQENFVVPGAWALCRYMFFAQWQVSGTDDYVKMPRL